MSRQDSLSVKRFFIFCYLNSQIVFSYDLYNITLTFGLQFLSNAAYSVKNYGTKNMVRGGGGGCYSYDLAPPPPPPHFSIRSAGPENLTRKMAEEAKCQNFPPEGMPQNPTRILRAFGARFSPPPPPKTITYAMH